MEKLEARLMLVADGNFEPFTMPDEFEGNQGTEMVIAAEQGLLVNDIDFERDPFITELHNNSQVPGTLNLAEDGSFTLSPDPDFVGEFVFTYVGNDGDSLGTGVSRITPVMINILPSDGGGEIPENFGPFTQADTYLALAGQTLVVDVTEGLKSNDIDVEEHIFFVASPLPGSEPPGELNVNVDGSFTYTPPDGVEFASYSFLYFAVDEFGAESVETPVNIEVIPPF